MDLTFFTAELILRSKTSSIYMIEDVALWINETSTIGSAQKNLLISLMLGNPVTPLTILQKYQSIRGVGIHQTTANHAINHRKSSK